MILTPHEATLLACPGAVAGPAVPATTRDRTDAIIEIVEGLLRGDRSRFLIERRVREGWTAEPDPSRSRPRADAVGADHARIAASLLDRHVTSA